MFEKHFGKLDKDGDGHISINELRQHFKAMGIRVTARTLNDLISEVDTNRNGQVEFEEFVQVRPALPFQIFPFCFFKEAGVPLLACQKC